MKKKSDYEVERVLYKIIETRVSKSDKHAKHGPVQNIKAAQKWLFERKFVKITIFLMFFIFMHNIV